MPLQIPMGVSYYPTLVPLNTGRNALEYILRLRKYTKVYIPYFTCEVLLEPFNKLNIEYEFYNIDVNLDPILDFKLDDNSALLYTNYFGIKTSTVMWLSSIIKNLIIDNAQAFFVKPISNVDTFYSCRKFFGVPDGAYVSTSTQIGLNLKTDLSMGRISHLLTSIEKNIEDGYQDYLANNEMLVNNEIRKMSTLTTKLLEGIDYEGCELIRKNNFYFLHKHLEKINRLRIEITNEDVPMVYPLLVEDASLRERLIENKIFIPTYWPNVFDWASPDSYEYFLAKNLITIPIDHRYNMQDMRSILAILNSLL